MPRSNLISKIGRLFSKVIRSINRGFSRIIGLSEGFEKYVKRLTRKTSTIGDAADSTLGGVIRKVFSPFTFVSRKLFNMISGVGQAFRRNPTISKATKKANWLWYPLLSMGAFFRHFFQSRRKGLLFWGIPLVTAMTSVLVFLFLLQRYGPRIPQTYRRAVEDAIEKGDFSTAQLYQRKLQSIGIEANRSDVRAIEDLIKQGKTAEAYQMAEELAPVDQPGSLEVHFWLVSQYLAEKSDDKGKGGLELAERHLENVKTLLLERGFEIDKLPPNLMLLSAMLEIRKSNVEKGMEILKSIGDQFWPAVVFQMELNLKMQRNEEALKNASTLLLMTKKDSQIIEDLNDPMFAFWSMAFLKARQNEPLREVVEMWHKRFPENKDGSRLWTQFQLVDIEFLISRGTTEDLEKASSTFVAMGNRNRDEPNELMHEWLVSRSKLIAAEKKLSLEKFIALVEESPEIPPPMGKLLGTLAASRGDNSRAIRYFRKVLEANPDDAVSWNNLAYVMTGQPGQDMNLALEAAEKALKLAPGNINMKHTRGAILIRLERWEEAIPDLKAYVTDNPNDKKAHTALAIAYRSLGNEELAKLHDLLGK